MKTRSQQQQLFSLMRPAPIWLKITVMALVGLGIVFRLFHLDQPVFWCDEATAAYWLSGNGLPELLNGQTISAETLRLTYQFPTPASTVAAVIKSLSQSDPLHPPLYYLLARFWTQAWGNSVTVIRSFSAFISILTLPALFWMGLELFGISLINWFWIAGFAISPAMLIYAQEAKQYSLWIFIAVISSALLLRALRTKKNCDWLLYCFSATLLLYTHLFALTTICGHCLYVLLFEKFKPSKNLCLYLTCCLGVILSFYPWTTFLMKRWSTIDTMAQFANEGNVFPLIMPSFLLNFSKQFLDINNAYFDYNIKQTIIHGSLETILLSIVITVFIISVMCYSIFLICRIFTWRISTFLLSFTGSSFLILLGLDLAKGGIRSTIIRYIIPSLLGMLIVVSSVAAYKLFESTRTDRFLGCIISVILIITSLSSDWKIVNSEIWWNKYFSNTNASIAKVINQFDRPLLKISRTSLSRCQSLSISHLLRSDVRLQLGGKPDINLSDLVEFSDIFFVTRVGNSSIKNRLNQADFRSEKIPLPENNNPYASTIELWRVWQ